MPHSLRDVVVTNTKQTDDTHPCRNNLAGQLPASVLAVRANAQYTSDDSKTDSVAHDDWVVCVLLCLVLCALSLRGGLILKLLRLSLDFLLTLLALGLGVGLYGLALVVGGNRGDVRAVDIDEGGYALLTVLNLGHRGGTTVMRR
jgi:hypothetical protein